MAKLSEKIGYALGDAAAGGITWKVMSIAFPLFFTNIFGLTVADTATLMLIARRVRLCHREERHLVDRSHLLIGYDGHEVWHSHQRFPGCPAVRHCRLCLWHRFRHWPDHRHHYRPRSGEQNDMGALLHLPSHHCINHDGITVYLSYQEIRLMALVLLHSF